MYMFVFYKIMQMQNMSEFSEISKIKRYHSMSAVSKQNKLAGRWLMCCANPLHVYHLFQIGMEARICSRDSQSLHTFSVSLDFVQRWSTEVLREFAGIFNINMNRIMASC